MIQGGLIYVGQPLEASNGRGTEPALIDPTLPIDFVSPDLAGTSLGYWAHYSRLSPRARAAYLSWLGAGRADPNTPIGYVFLYFYGLERRALHDALDSPAADAELSIIATEVARLLAVYGQDASFHRYATTFGQCLEVLLRARSEPPGPVPPTPSDQSWELPVLVRFELARMAAAGIPLPAEWALSWVLAAPDIYLRTPVHRCPDEFSRLFTLHYATEFGAGMRLPANKSRLQLTYRPASPGFDGEVSLRVGSLPDPSRLSTPTKTLQALVNSVTDQLDAYSRWIGKHPDTVGTLAAVSLLPPELINGGGTEAVDRLVGSVEEQLMAAEMAVVDADLLVSQWPVAAPGHLAKSEASALARLLAARGIGLEPDARHGGTLSVKGPAVVFRLGAGDVDPDERWLQTSAVIELVASFMRTTSRTNRDHAEELSGKLQAGLELPDTVRSRIAAHLWWAIVASPRPTGLKRRLSSYDPIQREAIGRYLVRLAAKTGAVTPAQLEVLIEAYKVLGIEPSELFSQVHQVEAGSVTDPLTVLVDRSPLTGKSASPSSQSSAAGIDFSLVRATKAETEAVAAFLGNIFVDDPDPESPARPTDQSTNGTLNASQGALLQELGQRPSWRRIEFDALASRFGLLPDAAIDALNEAALGAADELVCDGTDPIVINLDLVKDLLS